MADAKTRACALSAVFVLAALAFPGAEALAAPADTEPSAGVSDDGAYSTNEPIETCMQRWEADTHMSKTEWRATCIRMKKEREPSITDH